MSEYHSHPGTLRRESSAGESSGRAVIPTPRCPLSVRPATTDDLAFIDQLQKTHSHMVGFMHRKTIEKYIESEDILIAEGGETGERGEALGYCMFKDQYLKRDDVGIIYQLNVLPLKQRNLVGATLVKEVFARAAYGCRLYCLWCAQDIRANWFWESIGFVPLAFRTGSRGKQRIHIFWQRRVREGDEGGGATPWWFPYQTQAGAVREDRIVLPIPANVHWRDVMPMVLPDQEEAAKDQASDLPKTLPGGAPVKARPEQPKLSAAQRATIRRAQSAHLKGVPIGKKAVITGSGIKYVDRTDYVPELDDPEELREEAIKQEEKKKRATRPRAKHDPKMIKQARELRDRYLEAVNERGLLPEAWTDAKYDVSRALGSDDDVRVRPADVRLLDAA